MPQEILTLHVGDFGVRTVDPIWDVVSLQHGLGPDGTELEQRELLLAWTKYRCADLNPKATGLVATEIGRQESEKAMKLSNWSMFIESESGAWTPRREMVTGPDDVGPDLSQRVRKQMEKCDRDAMVLISHDTTECFGSCWLATQKGQDVLDQLPKNVVFLPLCDFNCAAKSDLGRVTRLLTHFGVTFPINDARKRRKGKRWQSVQIPLCDSVLRKGLDGGSVTIENVYSDLFNRVTLPLRAYKGCTFANLNPALVTFESMNWLSLSCFPSSLLSGGVSSATSLWDQAKEVCSPARSLSLDLPRMQELLSEDDFSLSLHSMGSHLMFQGPGSQESVNAIVRRIKSEKRIQFMDWSPHGCQSSIIPRCPLIQTSSQLREWPVLWSVLSDCLTERFPDSLVSLLTSFTLPLFDHLSFHPSVTLLSNHQGFYPFLSEVIECYNERLSEDDQFYPALLSDESLPDEWKREVQGFVKEHFDKYIVENMQVMHQNMLDVLKDEEDEGVQE